MQEDKERIMCCHKAWMRDVATCCAMAIAVVSGICPAAEPLKEPLTCRKGDLAFRYSPKEGGDGGMNISWKGHKVLIHTSGVLPAPKYTKYYWVLGRKTVPEFETRDDGEKKVITITDSVPEIRFKFVQTFTVSATEVVLDYEAKLGSDTDCNLGYFFKLAGAQIMGCPAEGSKGTEKVADVIPAEKDLKNPLTPGNFPNFERLDIDSKAGKMSIIGNQAFRFVGPHKKRDDAFYIKTSVSGEDLRKGGQRRIIVRFGGEKGEIVSKGS